jgi:hypothetical protein
METRFHFTVENFSVLTSLPEEGFSIMLPYILDFFSSPATDARAWVLISSIIDKLGRYAAATALTPHILNLLERESFDYVKHLLGYDFVYMIMEKLGLQYAFEHIFPSLFEALRSADSDLTILASQTLERIA